MVSGAKSQRGPDSRDAPFVGLRGQFNEGLRVRAVRSGTTVLH